MAWRWSSTDFLLNARFNCRLPKISIVRYWMQTAAAISAVFRDATAAGKDNEHQKERTGQRDAHRPNEKEISHGASLKTIRRGCVSAKTRIALGNNAALR